MQGAGRLDRTVLVRRAHPQGPHALLAVRRVRRDHLHVRAPDLPGPDVEDRGLEGEADRALGIVTGQAGRAAGGVPRWLSTTTASWASGRSRRRTPSGSSRIAAVVIGATADRCAQCPADSISRRPSVAVTVNVRSACSPGGGTGARSCSGRGAFDAGRHPQLGGPEHEPDLLSPGRSR